jgi:hypothetical protein
MGWPRLPLGLGNFQAREDGAQARLDAILRRAREGVHDGFDVHASEAEAFHHFRSAAGWRLLIERDGIARFRANRFDRFRIERRLTKIPRERVHGLADLIGWKPFELGAVGAGLDFPLRSLKTGVVFFGSQKLAQSGGGGVAHQMHHEIGEEGSREGLDLGWISRGAEEPLIHQRDETSLAQRPPGQAQRGAGEKPVARRGGPPRRPCAGGMGRQPEASLDAGPASAKTGNILFREGGHAVRIQALAEPLGQQRGDGGFAHAVGSGEFDEQGGAGHFLFERGGKCFQPARV